MKEKEREEDRKKVQPEEQEDTRWTLLAHQLCEGRSSIEKQTRKRERKEYASQQYNITSFDYCDLQPLVIWFKRVPSLTHVRVNTYGWREGIEIKEQNLDIFSGEMCQLTVKVVGIIITLFFYIHFLLKRHYNPGAT